MIYLDNGATSFPKPREMIKAMTDCMNQYCGNPGRSGHNMSLKCGEMVYNARKNVSKLFNIEDPSRLIFSKNTTEALNQALFGTLKKGDHVVTTSMEHNSVLRPLKKLEDAGVSHTIVKGDREGFVSSRAIEEAIRDNTKMIAVTGASNVTGAIMPLEEIGKIAKDRNLIFLVDGAQCAGSIEMDVVSCNIDMLAFPGHKGLLGPLGTGGLYVNERVEIEPLIYGGTGTESRKVTQPRDFPEAMESGTVNAPGIIGLGKSAEIIMKTGVENIEVYERELIYMLESDIRNIKGVQVYGPTAAYKTGISLFNIRGMECEEVTMRLNRDFNIAVRGGYHCSGTAHRTIGTWECGAVRLSVGPYNTKRDIRSARDAIWSLAKS